MQPDNVSRRDFLRSSAIGAGALSAGVGLAPDGRGSADRKRPNFVYIMSDQQHWQALGCVDPFFDTPSQDEFAADAALFERAFCTTARFKYNRYIDHGEELYDLVDDPGRAEIKQELVAELNRWIRENHDPFYSLSTTELKKGYQWPGDRSRKTGKKTPTLQESRSWICRNSAIHDTDA